MGCLDTVCLLPSQASLTSRLGECADALLTLLFSQVSAELRKNVDSDRFWVDFARDPSSPLLQAPVKTFLYKYVENSVKERVVLVPEERVMVRTLNSAYSIIEVWRKLVAAADHRVLRLEWREARRQGPPMICFFSSGRKKADDVRGPPISLSRYVRPNWMHFLLLFAAHLPLVYFTD